MNFLEIEGWKDKALVHGFGIKGNAGEEMTRQDWKGKPVSHRGESFPLISLSQVHGDRIRLFQGGEQEARDLWAKEGDALITRVPKVAIGVFTADCLPILLFEPEQRVIAIVHAGWRGTAQGVAGKVIEKMAETFACRREKIEAGLGPCIGPCCYEVDEPVEDLFRQRGYPWEFFASSRGSGKWSLDLWKANHFLLEKAGLRKERIDLLSYCTACRSDLFFSYRREQGTRGRHVNFISLR